MYAQPSFSKNVTRGRVFPGSGLGGYLFAFNGQEKDNDLYGESNTYVFEYRIHDARIGRFLSVDPLTKDFPWNSPYSFAENDINRCVDLEGKEKRLAIQLLNNENKPVLSYEIELNQAGPLGNGTLTLAVHLDKRSIPEKATASYSQLNTDGSTATTTLMAKPFVDVKARLTFGTQLDIPEFGNLTLANFTLVGVSFNSLKDEDIKSTYAWKKNKLDISHSIKMKDATSQFEIKVENKYTAGGGGSGVEKGTDEKSISMKFLKTYGLDIKNNDGKISIDVYYNKSQSAALLLGYEVALKIGVQFSGGTTQKK